MAKYLSTVNEAYIGYYKDSGETSGIKVKTLKNFKQPANIFKMDYIRYIANTFNFMINRVVVFSNRYNKPVREIIITDSDLADNIGCHVNHSYRVMEQIREIFGLEYKQDTYSQRVRTIKFNERIIDFLKIFSDEEFYAYMKKHKIPDRLHDALRQLYKYRIWGVKGGKSLSPSQNAHKMVFIQKQKDFFRAVASIDLSDQSRIDYIKQHQDKLSEYNKIQLKRIEQEKQRGKLAHYWFQLLIKLEQKISYIVNLVGKKSEPAEDSNTQFDRNQIEGSSVAHESATHEHRKIPEPKLQPKEYVEIAAAWNNIITHDETIKMVDKLSPELIKSIDANVNQIGKEKLLQAILKVPGLYHDQKYKYKITFEQFLNPKKITMLLNGPWTETFIPSWMALKEFEDFGLITVRYTDIESIPSFDHIEEAITWFNTMEKMNH